MGAKKPFNFLANKNLDTFNHLLVHPTTVCYKGSGDPYIVFSLAVDGISWHSILIKLKKKHVHLHYEAADCVYEQERVYAAVSSGYLRKMIRALIKGDLFKTDVRFQLWFGPSL